MAAASVQQDRLHGLLRILITLVLAGLITHGSYAGSGDEPHYLAIAHSIAFDFDLDLANNYGANEPLIAGGDLEAGSHVRQGRGVITRPVHDVGLPLLLSPIVRAVVPIVRWTLRHAPSDLLRRLRLTPTVLYRQFLTLFLIALAVALASVLFETFIDLNGRPRAAFAATLIVILSPPLMIFSVLLFTELLTAFLCLYAFRRIVLDDRDLSGPILRVASGTGSRFWFGTGIVVGLLLLVHVRNIGLVIGLTGLGVFTLSRHRSWQDLSRFIAGLVIPLTMRTMVTYHFWGTLVTTPHGRLGEWQGLAATFKESGIRLAGLFLDQEYGLFVYGPIYVLAVAGLGAMKRLTAARLLVVAACYLAPVIWPVTNVHGWTGQWSPAARMLVPIVPLLALGLVAAARALPRLVVVPIVALQIAISGYMWQNPKNLWNDGDGVAAICSRGSWNICAYLPSFATRSQ